jgi:hypothetical protein
LVLEKESIKNAGNWLQMTDRVRRFAGYNNMKKYPQVRKTGVDAVHEKLPTDGLYHEKNCNL